MKVCIVAVFCALISVALGYVDFRAGRPQCKTDEEFEIVNFRNLWDPTAYWQCQKRNSEGVLVRCKAGAFQPRLRKCVNWNDWEWEKIIAPLTVAQ